MLRSRTDGTMGLYLKQVNGPVLANLMDGYIYEPASAIKVLTNLYTMRRVQAGTVTPATLIPKYVASPGSCPGNTINGSESIDTAAREMMWHSDSTRTRELNDYFTTAKVNLLANTIGLVHTAINHVVGCGGRFRTRRPWVIWASCTKVPPTGACWMLLTGICSSAIWPERHSSTWKATTGRDYGTRTSRTSSIKKRRRACPPLGSF